MQLILIFMCLDSDVSYNCNDPVIQSGCSVMRNRPLLIFLFIKIKAFLLMRKLLSFMLQRIKYQRLFHWQRHLLFPFYEGLYIFLDIKY